MIRITPEVAAERNLATRPQFALLFFLTVTKLTFAETRLILENPGRHAVNQQ